jgi:hypothetical protein
VSTFSSKTFCLVLGNCLVPFFKTAFTVMNVKLLVALVCRLNYGKENCSVSPKSFFYYTSIYQNFLWFCILPCLHISDGILLVMHTISSVDTVFMFLNSHFL